MLEQYNRKASNGDDLRPKVCDRKTRRDTRRIVAKIIGADGERPRGETDNLKTGNLCKANVLC